MRVFLVWKKIKHVRICYPILEIHIGGSWDFYQMKYEYFERLSVFTNKKIICCYRLNSILGRFKKNVQISEILLPFQKWIFLRNIFTFETCLGDFRTFVFSEFLNFITVPKKFKKTPKFLKFHHFWKITYIYGTCHYSDLIIFVYRIRDFLWYYVFYRILKLCMVQKIYLFLFQQKKINAKKYHLSISYFILQHDISKLRNFVF